MTVNVNTQKALGGNNPIKLSGGSGDANNSIAGWFEAPQGSSVPFSSFYRKTDKDLTRNDFDFNNNNVFVPDATENATVATSGPISFSDFRGQSNQGVIKEYVITQSNHSVNLDLDGQSWNSNLNKNVPKIANINGRLTSGSAPSGQSHAGYNHKSGSALHFDAEAYNLNINVDTASGVSVEWALANGVDLVRLPGLVDLAYKAMVNDTGRTDGKPSDIEGYLNDIIIKQSTNEDKLFKTEEGTPMSAELFQIMTQNIEHILTSQGQQSDFTGISNYINVASQVWSGTNELKDGTPDPDNLTQADRDKWNSKSSSGKGADTTGFYEWLQSELAKEMG